MNKCVIVILVTFHLMGSSLCAANFFLERDHIHSYIDKCDIHQHHHSHNGSSHQHKHSHSQSNINFTDFFTDIQNINLFDFSNPTQTYTETVSWIPNSTLESLFRPPKI